MASSRRGLHGVVLVEDRRTERFFRHLLGALGFDLRGSRVRFQVAPSGKGAAEDWVRKRYPDEVRYLRSRHAARFLLAARDGDASGVAARKVELESSLAEAGLAGRSAGEHIATPVPTWSIESWLLDLLGAEGLDEERRSSRGEGPPWKQVYERLHGEAEREALRGAAEGWRGGPASRPELPSLVDGRAEMARIDP